MTEGQNQKKTLNRNESCTTRCCGAKGSRLWWPSKARNIYIGRDGPGVFPVPSTQKSLGPHPTSEPACSTKLVLLARSYPFSRNRRILTQESDVFFVATICSMDATSMEGPSNIATLVHSPSKLVGARNLRGDQAQKLINLLDQVSCPDRCLIP